MGIWPGTVAAVVFVGGKWVWRDDGCADDATSCGVDAPQPEIAAAPPTRRIARIAVASGASLQPCWSEW
jgi:hypothetical protein